MKPPQTLPAQMPRTPPTTRRQLPVASDFVTSPLRNRIRVQLDAPTSDVWALIGDLPRYPEYSSGMARVDPELDAKGTCTAYVCHFKPTEPGVAGLRHREVMRWYEPGRGYASQPADEVNAFGLVDCLTLITLEASQRGTLLTWDEYFHAADLEMNTKIFDDALADIAEHLVAHFGGTVLERRT